MSFENSAGLSVHNQYGARKTGGGVGQDHAQTKIGRLHFDLTGESLNGTFVPPTSLNNGVTILSANLIVSEAFSVAGSSIVELGEDGAEVTNGLSLTEAQLEATGVTDVASGLAGEWAVGSQITGPIDLGITFSAGSVSDATIGKAKVVIEYIDAVTA